MVILWILLTAVLIGLSLFLLIWFVLAPRNLWFTFVKEGTAKVVVRGDKFEKALIQWEGYTFDKKWNVVEGKEPWHPFGGLRYYGFWPIKDIYIYDFEWTNVKGDGTIEHHPEEVLDYILLKEDVYYFKIETAEDIELLPMELEVVMTVRVVNPYKALFVVQNWLETVINRTRPAIRDAVTQKRYDELIKNKEAVGREIYKILRRRKLLEEFQNRYGVEVRKIEVKEINPGKEYREATLKKYLAEREKERITTLADAKKQELERVAEGERIRIEKVYSQIRKFGDLGRLIRALEAMEKSPLAANMTVQAIPGLSEMLRGIFGRDKINQTEIRELVKELKKINKAISERKSKK
ncbi:SPFH/Band 7/PHB domain protein [bacterium]|nr:SPFH/Band 7/PHB domain protein [bacterium]